MPDLDLDGYCLTYDAHTWLSRAAEYADDQRVCILGESCPVCHLAIPSYPRMVAGGGQRFCVCNLADGHAIPIDAMSLLDRHGLRPVAHMLGMDERPRSPLHR